MKRYKPIIGEVIKKLDPYDLTQTLTYNSKGFEEDDAGQFVRYSDHLRVVEQIKMENPIYRIEKLEEQLGQRIQRGLDHPFKSRY